MPQLCEDRHCVGCGACRQICPRHCIAMFADDHGFLHPQIDKSACIGCKRCEQVCPVGNGFKFVTDPPKAYAAHMEDTAIVDASSSGGVFTALAAQILDEGGIVFGAAFDESLAVHHIAVEKPEELTLLRGSKYVQSVIGDTYSQAKAALREGRKVLFSGTPCQIAGLRRFLGKEYANLVCVDTICHSVPSPAAWQAYLRQTETREGQPVVAACFRDKRDGWQNYCLCLRLKDEKEVLARGNENQYMRAFLQGLSTRSSCAICRFKGQNRESDITLGDFWGVQTVLPEAFNSMGTSLVLTNTKVGQALLDSVMDQLHIQPVDAKTALAPNPAYSQPFTSHPRRQLFWAELEKAPFTEAVKAALAPTMRERILNKWRNTLVSRGLRKVKALLHIKHP